MNNPRKKIDLFGLRAMKNIEYAMNESRKLFSLFRNIENPGNNPRCTAEELLAKRNAFIASLDEKNIDINDVGTVTKEYIEELQTIDQRAYQAEYRYVYKTVLEAQTRFDNFHTIITTVISLAEKANIKIDHTYILDNIKHILSKILQNSTSPNEFIEELKNVNFTSTTIGLSDDLLLQSLAQVCLENLKNTPSDQLSDKALSYLKKVLINFNLTLSILNYNWEDIEKIIKRNNLAHIDYLLNKIKIITTLESFRLAKREITDKISLLNVDINSIIDQKPTHPNYGDLVREISIKQKLEEIEQVLQKQDALGKFKDAMNNFRTKGNVSQNDVVFLLKKLKPQTLNDIGTNFQEIKNIFITNKGGLRGNF